MQGSNSTGVYADRVSNLYNFTYTYDANSSRMNTSLLINFSIVVTFSPTFSAANTRLILTSTGNITLYLNCIPENCASKNSLC